jgi:uncharacterized Zn finger protein (UPF0148 family)
MNRLIICPLCGFSFKITALKPLDGKIICPMCGHKFKDPDFFLYSPEESNNK